MRIQKSEGVTNTEKYLGKFCENTFLKLWSYLNPIKEDGDELCDLLAVFDNHIYIFFDRESRILNKNDKDIITNWKRWKRKVIDSQIRTANGAEKYIKNGGKIFIDKEKNIPFPVKYNLGNVVTHKIIIAHGAKDACEKYSEENKNGSLAILYTDTKEDFAFPFGINIDKNNPIHIFDTFNLPIIFKELDTFFDFNEYLNAKTNALKKFDLIYCGEEDLLAHYFYNFDEDQNRHYIGTKDEDITSILIGEGEWNDFEKKDLYKNKKRLDKISYIWDEFIQRTCQNSLDGILGGDSLIFEGKSAIHEMAKEPRFHRRYLSDFIIKAIRNFPENDAPIMRHVVFMPSFIKNNGYVFLQLKVKKIINYEDIYRPRRQEMLRIACGAAKNKFPHLKKVIGVAIDAPKYATGNSEDLLLLDCNNWTNDDKKNYEKENKQLNFFTTSKLKMTYHKTVEFPGDPVLNENNLKK